MKAKFQVITLFPEMIERIFSEGVVGQAAKHGLVSIQTLNPRRHSEDVHQTVDDRPFGGGDGMVMLAENLDRALADARASSPRGQAIYLSPQGERLTDSLVRELALQPDLILICGRYGGIDQRFLVRNRVRELSIGDYVLSGGELAAAVLIDAVARQIPGVLGHAESAEKESFSQGLLEAPLFTRPREWKGQSVPEVLLSGNHARIREWQEAVSRFVTFAKRPDLKPFAGLPAKGRVKLMKIWSELKPEEKETLGLGGVSDSSLRSALETENS
jgi:tRNA (guanine37-N1)-methyltransferase